MDALIACLRLLASTPEAEMHILVDYLLEEIYTQLYKINFAIHGKVSYFHAMRLSSISV